ncbi:hypothetical protein ALC62_02243 [Cyphomyrmex costatus]|uniref:CCHC-type domain-containing protein n=1 Tax=Cyphomyrmex costatus TaxID=456900 RepID=A0A195D3B5_9HYME|nr:hypothetical protein ALC62_02243 [Cyphomyrmex costatus]
MSDHNAKNCRTNNNSNNQNKLSIICQWCDKPGHSASNCWKKQNEQHNIQNKTKIIYEEVEVQVLTLRLNSLNELFGAKEEITNKVCDAILMENNEENRNEEDESSIKTKMVIKNIMQNEDENEIKREKENSREESFRTSLLNSTPVDWKEGSYQTSLSNATQSSLMGSKEKTLSQRNQISKN